jgi:hypothetical protein
MEAHSAIGKCMPLNAVLANNAGQAHSATRVDMQRSAAPVWLWQDHWQSVCPGAFPCEASS